MKSLVTMVARCTYAWLLVVLAYGFVNFWDAPYKRCGTDEVYCGKRGTRHSLAEAAHLKKWERIFIGSWIVALGGALALHCYGDDDRT